MLPACPTVASNVVNIFCRGHGLDVGTREVIGFCPEVGAIEVSRLGFITGMLVSDEVGCMDGEFSTIGCGKEGKVGMNVGDNVGTTIGCKDGWTFCVGLFTMNGCRVG